MARPKKQTVDYFPHQCNHGKTMFILEQRYGNDGYAFWFKLLEQLGSTDGHFIDASDNVSWSFLCAKSRVSEETGEAILDLLAEIDAIDSELWTYDRVIWVNKFVENVTDAYRNRVVEVPSKPGLKRKIDAKEDDNLRKIGDETQQTTVENPQMKLNETKVKEKKIFSSSSDEVRLASLLLEKIQKRKPDIKKPNLQSWAKDVDLLLRIDMRSPPTVERVISWCQADTFWQKNILSPGKLREHFDRLEMQMNGGGNGPTNGGSGGAGGPRTFTKQREIEQREQIERLRNYGRPGIRPFGITGDNRPAANPERGTILDAEVIEVPEMEAE